MLRTTRNHPATQFCDHPATSHQYDLREFYLDRQARNLAPKTLQWYAHSLTLWLDFAAQHAIQDTEKLTPSHLRRFLLELSNQQHNAGGVANIFGALKAFLNWYADESAPPEWQNPLRKVKNPKRPQEPLEPLPLADFRAMLAQCPAKTFTGDRDRAVLLFLLDSGLRHQELTDLIVGDVDMNTGAVLVRNGMDVVSLQRLLGHTSFAVINRYLKLVTEDLQRVHAQHGAVDNLE